MLRFSLRPISTLPLALALAGIALLSGPARSSAEVSSNVQAKREAPPEARWRDCCDCSRCRPLM